MRAIGNFLWFVLGGVLMGLGWWLVGLLCILTIAGIALAPIGKAIVTNAVAEAARRRNAEVSVSQLRGG